MEKKSFLKERILIIALGAVLIGAYFCYSPFRSFMQEVFRVFATGDFQKLKGICSLLRGLCSGDFLPFDGITVHYCAATRLFNYLCKCRSFRLLEGCFTFLVQCHDGSGFKLLYRQSLRKRVRGEA